MQEVYKYYAFISYKHEDEKHAMWLQKRLETYRIPAVLQSKETPKSIKPVFRDNTDLTPGRHLRPAIKDKLRESKYLIVICSRNLAKESEYVNFEIESFVEMGKADKIIPVIVDGEPHAENPENECFCSAVKALPGEVLAANVVKDGRYIAGLKIIAALLNLDADDLIKRDERRRKKNRIISASVATFLVVLGILAVTAIFNARFAVNAEKAMEAYNNKQYAEATVYAYKALKIPVKKAERAEVEAIARGCLIAEGLKGANSQFHKEYEVTLFNDGVSLYGESSDGSRVGFTDLENVWVCDSATGDLLGTYHIEDDKQELYSMIDVVVFEKYELKKEEKYIPEKYKEIISKCDTFSVLGVCSIDDDVIHYTGSVDNDSGFWVYSSDESVLAVYHGDSERKIEVHSFESKKSFYLNKEYTAVRSIRFSPLGGYMFVEYKGDTNDVDYVTDVYDLSANTVVAELSDLQKNGFFESFVFSTVDKGQLYVFNPYKAEKYVFEDKKFDAEMLVPSADGEYMHSILNPDIYDVQFSADGEKYMTVSVEYENGIRFSVYSVSDRETGSIIFSQGFLGTNRLIDFTPDLNYTVFADGEKLFIIDIGEMKTFEYTADSSVMSVGISAEASTVVFTTETGKILCMKNTDGEYTAVAEKTVGDKNEYIMVKTVSDDICVVEYDDTEYTFDAVSNQIEKLQDNFTGGRFLKDGSYTYRTDVIKSERILNCGDFQNVLFETEPYLVGASFFDMETRQCRDYDFVYYKWAFSPQSGLCAGMAHNEQVQYDSDVEIRRLDSNGSYVLYTLTLNRMVYEMRFDNTGEYLIVNYEEGCEVYEAETGKKLFTIDRNILIHDNTVYDISSDLVLPDKLPSAPFPVVG